MAKEAQVINFNKAREAQIEERRRKYGRILFKQLLGTYCVIEGEALKAVELVDISPEGLSFQLPLHSKNLESVKEKKDLIFRLYFSEDTYIPIHVEVKNKRECVEDGQTFMRFGCLVDSKTTSFEAYKLFVEFLNKYAETSHYDRGELKVFFF